MQLGARFANLFYCLVDFAHPVADLHGKLELLLQISRRHLNPLVHFQLQRHGHIFAVRREPHLVVPRRRHRAPITELRVRFPQQLMWPFIAQVPRKTVQPGFSRNLFLGRHQVRPLRRRLRLLLFLAGISPHQFVLRIQHFQRHWPLWRTLKVIR